MVGHQRELRATLDLVRAGRGVVVTGPEGSGRTTFARAVATAAEHQASAPLWVPATSTLTDVPFGALGWLLGAAHTSGDRAAALARSPPRCAATGGRGRPS